MSRLALKNKAKREPKFSSRHYNRVPYAGVKRFFAAVPHVSDMFPFSQLAWGHSGCN